MPCMQLAENVLGLNAEVERIDELLEVNGWV